MLLCLGVLGVWFDFGFGFGWVLCQCGGLAVVVWLGLGLLRFGYFACLMLAVWLANCCDFGFWV